MPIPAVGRQRVSWQRRNSPRRQLLGKLEVPLLKREQQLMKRGRSHIFKLMNIKMSNSNMHLRRIGWYSECLEIWMNNLGKKMEQPS